MPTQIQLVKKYGLSVRGISGQHLLIDPNMQRKIVDVLAPLPKDRILEIGPGLGALTGLILEHGARVWAVEKDKRFAEILEGELGGEYKDRLTILNRDILELKLNQIATKRVQGPWKVISNLPYYITAPILFHLFNYAPLFSKAILMMQKEVARRLVATPCTKDYSRLTLAARYYTDCKILFDVPPRCFSPEPEVDSSLVEMEFHPRSKLLAPEKEALFFDLVKVAFSQRRKTLLHALSRNSAWKIKKEEFSAAFEALGLSLKVRAEELLLKDFLALAERLTPSP